MVTTLQFDTYNYDTYSYCILFRSVRLSQILRVACRCILNTIKLKKKILLYFCLGFLMCFMFFNLSIIYNF